MNRKETYTFWKLAKVLNDYKREESNVKRTIKT
jgi:hypothetical protein